MSHPQDSMTPITRLEAHSIAKDAAQEALDRYTHILPDQMKPLMYEVAEKVSHKAETAMHDLFSSIFGVDVHNKDNVREFQKDLFWARDRRLEDEQNSRALKNAIRQQLVRATMLLIGSAIAIVTGWKVFTGG